mgnify:CR=1 FL=1
MENKIADTAADDAERAAIQSTIEMIPVGICVFESDGGRITCVATNRRYSEMVGMEPEEVVGSGEEEFISMVHPEDRAQCRSDALNILPKKGSVSGTYRVFNAAKKEYDWIRLDGKYTVGPGGKSRAYFTYNNMNTLVQAERVANDNRRALNSMMQFVPGGVFVYSAEEDERFSFVGENMLAMLGYSREEFDRKFDGVFSKMVYKDDRERVLKEIWDQIAVGPYDTCRYRIEKKDGTLLWAHDEGHIVTDENGKRWFYVVIVDVTSSERAKDELISKNRELQELIDSIPVCIVVYKKLGRDFRMLAVNGYMSRTANMTKEETRLLTREELTELVHPDDRSAVAEFFDRLYTDESGVSELTYRTALGKSGGYQWYNCSAISSPQADGSVLIYTVYVDASDQKMKEADFNRIVQELLLTNPGSMCAFRMNLTKNTCSDGHGVTAYASRLLDARTADELIEKIASLITNEKDAENFRANYSRSKLMESYRDGRNNLSMTYRRLTDGREDGTVETHWVTTYFHIVLNPYNKDVETIVYSVDYDREYKEGEIVSVLTNEEYDCIGLIDPNDGRVSYYYISGGAVGAGEVMPGNYEDSIGMLLNRMLSETERQDSEKRLSLDYVKEKLKNEPVYIHSLTCLNSVDEKCRKQISFRYLADQDEIMFAQSDVTLAFLHEEENMERLRAALESAEKANAMKSSFLGNVSHDMRTPLNAILGYDRLALQAAEPEEKNGYLEKIGVAGETLLSLINDTLDLQKIETGAIALHPSPVRCADVVKGITASVRPLMEQKNIQFTIDNSRAVMATINADSVRLREIFINLLSNAAKYTPSGGHVAMTIECTAMDPGRVCDKVTISDDGIGMSREFQERMFEPFSQERTKDNAAVGGSGLGLSIVKRLVELMGGRIEVESELGRGSSFIVSIDFERVDDRLAAPGGDAEPADDIAGVRVLLCEDNAMNTEIAKKVLEMQGAKVTATADGLEGCAVFESSAEDDFDVILMDIRMPNMNGYDAAKHIRASAHPRAKTIPIIAMTADAYASDVDKAIACGMNSHVAKPIDPAVMAQEIARLTGRNA